MADKSDTEAHGTPHLQAAQGWPASRLIHRAVVHAQQVAQSGEVVDVVFSPESRQIVGLLVGIAGAEGGPLELLRRLLGVDLGLTFVPIERVLALSGDVVMIDVELGRSVEWMRPLPPVEIRHLPRMQASRGFAVLTMQGQQLGRFADLQLDVEGRSVTGYIVEREPAAPLATPRPEPAPSPQAAAPSPSAPAAPLAPPSPAPTPAAVPLLIPARFRVRFGRGLVVVGEDVSRPVVPPAPAGQNAEWPAPRWADEGQEAPAPGENRPTEPPDWPDAPTEQVRPPE